MVLGKRELVLVACPQIGCLGTAIKVAKKQTKRGLGTNSFCRHLGESHREKKKIICSVKYLNLSSDFLKLYLDVLSKRLRKEECQIFFPMFFRDANGSLKSDWLDSYFVCVSRIPITTEGLECIYVVHNNGVEAED